MPVHRQAGVTFASALRAILRQDPDVVMIGEMRDQETAEIAVQAAMTGHLVFSTLHTNDAISAIPRLLDLGIPDYLVAATLEGVLAQRLVRRVCPDCRESYEPTPESVSAVAGGTVADESCFRAAPDVRCVEARGFAGASGSSSCCRSRTTCATRSRRGRHEPSSARWRERRGSCRCAQMAGIEWSRGSPRVEEVIRVVQD